MNEIRQLCTISSSTPDEHFDEILALFHACPPQHQLSSLSLICQSISCMTNEQFHWNLLTHPIFDLIQTWSMNLFNIWLQNRTFNGDEYRAIFYIHQLYKFLSEYLNEQEQNQFVNIDLFLNENFLQILSQIIDILIERDCEHLSDDDLSTDEIHLQTETSDVQAKQTDVVDVLYRCLNSLILLYSNQQFIHPILERSIYKSLKSNLFIRLAEDFCQENLCNETIHIRSRFFLITCFDYCLLSNGIQSKISLIPSLKSIWNSQCSLLISRCIRLMNQILSIHINESFYSIIRTNFFNLCRQTDLVDELNTLILTICSIQQGKDYLRQSNFVRDLLIQIQFHEQFWFAIGILLTSNDLKSSDLLKSVEQKTITVLQSLTNNFEMNQSMAIEWFRLLREYFFCYSNLTKEFRFIPVYLKIIVSCKQNSELIDIMIDLLLTLILNSSGSISKNSEFYHWLKTDDRLASKLILLLLNQQPVKTCSIASSICFISTNEICLSIANQNEYVIENICTSKCQSTDGLIELLNRLSLCIFFVDIQTKFDNIGQFIYTYLSRQSSKICFLAVFIGNQCDFRNTWLDNLSLSTIDTLEEDIRKHFKFLSSNFLQQPIDSWSTAHVIQWCQTCDGYFPSLYPLVYRLNGRALLHLAEILAIEPATMYHSLNEELLQRTGTTIPLTEYVALRSELQKLTAKKTKKIKYNSRLCTLF